MPRFSTQKWTAGSFRCNFIKIHRRLRTSPAIAAGVTDRLWSVEAAVLAQAKRPADCWAKSWLGREIGGHLLSREGYMSNQELAERLDASGLPCRYADDWETALSRMPTAMNYVGEIRKWVHRPGKSPSKK
jgi:hypothetical protein